jgi:hypothetical protein
MPFINREEIPMAVRHPHLTEYKEQLRQRLLLASSEAEKAHLRGLLAKAIGNQPYTPDSPPPLGAIDLPTLRA